MRRTDRLYALVEELRARAPRPVTRAELADRLEITPRTVERDILALQQSGVPIWSQRGRGGGYALDPRWSLPPLNFDATEALAVIAALTAARSMPFAAAGRRAERKLLAAMPEREAAKAREVAARLRLGTSAPAGVRGIVAAAEEAVVARSVVELGYRDRDGRTTSRTVEAHGLQVSANGSYLLGWCRLRDAARAFRLDRIVSLRDTGEIAPEREVDGVVDWVDDVVVPAVTEGDAMPVQARSVGNRRPGPPRKADRRTGANAAFAHAVALGLGGVSARERRAVTTYSVGEHAFAAVDGGEDALVVLPGGGDEQHLLLRTVGRDEVRTRIEDAWARHAPKAAVAGHRRARARRMAEPALTQDDVRRLILALPGATEGPIWGRSVGFLIGSEKRTRFARFGPPEGDGVGNLLPPDDEDTVVLFHCEQKPALLAASPDRFFTTPHYGDEGEPGGIIIRLCEHRGAAEIAELTELIEEAWRHVAPGELVEQLRAPSGAKSSAV